MAASGFPPVGTELRSLAGVLAHVMSLVFGAFFRWAQLERHGRVGGAVAVAAGARLTAGRALRCSWSLAGTAVSFFGL